MNYIKDNGMMEKLPFWKFGGKSSSAEKYLFENEKRQRADAALQCAAGA